MSGAEALIVILAKYGPSAYAAAKAIFTAEKVTLEMLDALDKELISGEALIPKRQVATQ